jgi:hypothetical protein
VKTAAQWVKTGGEKCFHGGFKYFIKDHGSFLFFAVAKTDVLVFAGKKDYNKTEKTFPGGEIFDAAAIAF